MRPYGQPRRKELLAPDKADIKNYGLSAPDRCARKDRGKTKTRRIWKKRQRAIFKRIDQKQY